MSDSVEEGKIEEVVEKPVKAPKAAAVKEVVEDTKPQVGPNERLVEFVGPDGKIGYKVLRKFYG
jgi:hypothetical protein